MNDMVTRRRALEGKTAPLQKLCKSITDCHHSTPTWTVGGKIVVRNFNVKNGALDLSNPSFTDEKTFKERVLRAKPEPGDLIITREAPMGEICIIPEGVECCLGQRMVLIKPDRKKVSSKYLLYAMLSDFVQGQINQSDKTGSTVSNLRIPLLKELEIPLLQNPDEVAAVLSALDAKIDCNNRINAELEALAKTLYNYWFVQFDFPDANGKPYKSSGGRMVYNAALKREIPEGWRDGSLWDIARYFNGLAMQKHRPIGRDYLPVIKIKEMGEGVTENTERASPDIPKDAIVDDGDVLFSWSATLDVRIWSQGKGALNQHIFKVTSNKYPRTFYYFELLAYLAHFKMMAEKRKTTMGHITQDHLKQSRVCIPPPELLLTAHKIIDPFLRKHLLHEKENQQLAQLRDWLLPLLMNGQVKVA